MKIKTQKLQGNALDYAVALTNGFLSPLFKGEVARVVLQTYAGETKVIWNPKYYGHNGVDDYSPSKNWFDAGSVIEGSKISIQFEEGIRSAYFRDKLFCDDGSECWSTGETALVAAMRCFVQSKLGSEVEIPNEILE